MVVFIMLWLDVRIVCYNDHDENSVIRTWGLEGVLEIREINIDKDKNSLMKAFNLFRLNLIATILCVPQITFIE
jgi:hypothetical protein